MAADVDREMLAAPDIGEHLLELVNRIIGESIRAEFEIEDEASRRRRLGGERCGENLVDIAFAEIRFLDGAFLGHMGRFIGLIQDDFRGAVIDRDLAHLAVSIRHHDEERLAEAGRLRLGAGGDGNDEREADGEGGEFRFCEISHCPAPPPTRTRNLVPRTPRIADGVFTRMASDEPRTISPESIATVPDRRSASMVPSRVLGL